MIGAISPIPHLLRACRPSAIARLVIAVVVDAFNGMAKWAWPHVIEKCRERIEPSGIDSYASTAVVLEVSSVRIKTARFHGLPRSVFARSLTMPRRAVSGHTGAHTINGETSATPRFARRQRSRLDKVNLSAIATTFDSRTSIKCFVGISDNEPSFKSLPDKHGLVLDASSASARSGLSCAKRLTSHDHRAPAIAPTGPERLHSRARTGGAPNDKQMSESLAYQVNDWHWKQLFYRSGAA